MEFPPANDVEHRPRATSAPSTRSTMEVHLRDLLQSPTLSERLATDGASSSEPETSGMHRGGVLLDVVGFLRRLEAELGAPMTTALPYNWPPGRCACVPSGFHLLGVLALERRAPAGVLAECLGFYLKPGEAPEPLFAVILAVAATLDADDTPADLEAAIIPELLAESRRLAGDDPLGLQRQVAGVQLFLTLVTLMRAAAETSNDKDGVILSKLALEQQRGVLNQELRRIASHRSPDRFTLRGVRDTCRLRGETHVSAPLTGTVYPDQLVIVKDVRGDWCLVAARSYRTGAPHHGWMNRHRLGALDIPALILTGAEAQP